jgi:branched-chain amino acid transport system permease protein
MTLARLVPYGVFVGAVLLLPAVVTRVPLFTMANGVQMAVVAIAALGLVPLTGYARQISLGQAVFYGTGAYSSALLTTAGLPALLAAAAGAALACSGAYLIGRLLFRVQGHYLALATIALGLVASIAVRRLGFTGGSEGLSGIPPLAPALVTDVRFFYVAAGVLIVAVVAVRELLDARLGRALSAVGDAPVAAAAAGVDVAARKRHAFVLAALLASVAGSLYAHWVRYVDPSALELPLSLQMLIVATVGGLRTVWGPPAGAVIVVSLLQLSQEALPEVSDRVGGQTDVIAYGVALVLTLLLLPNGVAGTVADAIAGRVRGVVRPAVSGSPSLQPACAAVDRPVRLEVERLRVSFGGVRAVDDLTLRHDGGGVVGLIGPNGAGKTTVINVLSGLVRPAGGVIRVGGRAIGGRRPDRLARAGVARTFQTPQAFGSLSVVDSVLVAAEAHDRRTASGRLRGRAVAVLADVGLRDRLDIPATALPYGAQRRVELARAIVARPGLLLLDEPLAGLSRAEGDELCVAIRALARRGVTVLLVEHNVNAVMRTCDRVVVLDRGAVLADGTPAEIRADERVRSAYLGPV